MVRVAGLLLFLSGAVIWLGGLDALAIDQPVDSDAANWVRTTAGWEKLTLSKPPIPQAFGLHPLVVGAGQLCVSLLALVAFCPVGTPGYSRLVKQELKPTVS